MSLCKTALHILSKRFPKSPWVITSTTWLQKFFEVWLPAEITSLEQIYGDFDNVAYCNYCFIVQSRPAWICWVGEPNRESEYFYLKNELSLYHDNIKASILCISRRPNRKGVHSSKEHSFHINSSLTFPDKSLQHPFECQPWSSLKSTHRSTWIAITWIGST